MFVGSCLIRSYSIRSCIVRSYIIRSCFHRSYLLKSCVVLLQVFNHLGNSSNWSIWSNSFLCPTDLFWSYVTSFLLGVLLQIDPSMMVYTGLGSLSSTFCIYIRSLALFMYYAALFPSHTIYKLPFFCMLHLRFIYLCTTSYFSSHVSGRLHLFMQYIFSCIS